MKLVIAMDSFKGSLDAVSACRIVARGIQSAYPEARVALKPMADGGEGTAQAMLTAMGGKWIACEAMGPLPAMTVDAGYAWFEETGDALVEMACAAGLMLLEPSQYNPLKTTTFGVGQLIKAAAGRGARRILLAVGGSATVDGGVGAAMALGWRFLDDEGNEIPLGGRDLGRLHRIEPPASIELPPMEVLTDVTNPLCGERGAARIFGPQKGATPEMVEQLEAGLCRMAEVVKRDLGKDLPGMPGAGAAGGLSAGAVAFMNAQIVSGIDAVMEATRFADSLSSADWVITGEGSFDSQSLHGKVVSGVIREARAAGARIAVIAGSVSVSPTECESLGIVAMPTRRENQPLDQALANARGQLFETARSFAERHLTRGWY